MSPVDFNRRRCWRWRTLFLIVGVLLCCSWSTVESQLADPKFKAPIMNVTAPVGREAMLTCVVEDLANYKVAWLRVDTQTILTIASHVITKNHRIGVTHSEHRTWYLHIKEVKETDRGYYMCQINTDPMKSQNGYLDVVVSPDIIDSGTSTDMLVKENDNVTLSCAATGSPTPTIQWRREDGQEIFPNSKYKSEPRGSDLVLGRVSRYHMGSYLCLASNGVPPSVSKRISLTVQFPPTIKSSSQMIGVMEGQEVTLECISEAYPKSINYWTIGDNKIVPYKDNKYVAENLDSKVPYKVHMKLTIKSVSASDFGAYKCTSRNTMGDTDNEIRLYKLPSSSGYSYNNENDAGYQGKQRKNTRNNIPGGNQDMLKEKSSNQGGRKEHGDYEDAASGAPPRLVLDCGWTLVLLLLLLRTALGSSLCSPA